MLSFVTDSASSDSVELRDTDEPDPAPDETLVAVRAYTVSRGETYRMKGRPDGYHPGQEVVGVVLQAAADGSGPHVGARVAGIVECGSWSERVAVPGSQLGLIPDAVSFEDATSGIFALMADRAIKEAGLVAGQRVLVTGATGPVGYMAVQLALLAGATVTAQVSGPHRAPLIEPLGNVKVVTEVAEQPGAYDLVLDGVGGTMLTTAVRSLAAGGLVLTYGVVTNTPAMIAAPDFRDAPRARLGGFFIWRTDLETFGEDLTELFKLYVDGRLKPLIGRCLGWLDTPEMIRAVKDRQVPGKAVLTIPR